MPHITANSLNRIEFVATNINCSFELISEVSNQKKIKNHIPL